MQAGLPARTPPPNGRTKAVTETDQTGEEWRPVEGWPYEVSDLGRVRRSEGAPGTFAGRVLTPRVNHKGYETLTLSKDGVASLCFVHRLVLKAFLGPCPEGCETDHINGVRTDNRVSNLRWRDKAENRGEGVRKLTEDEVVEIRELYDTGEFSYRELANRYGIGDTTVREAVVGKWWRNAGGPIQGGGRKLQIVRSRGARHSQAVP